MFNSTTAVVRIDTWQAVLQNLTAGIVYRITVAAVNGAVRNNGLGMASTERTATTLSCELVCVLHLMKLANVLFRLEFM